MSHLSLRLVVPDLPLAGSGLIKVSDDNYARSRVAFKTDAGTLVDESARFFAWAWFGGAFNEPRGGSLSEKA